MQEPQCRIDKNEQPNKEDGGRDMGTLGRSDIERRSLELLLSKEQKRICRREEQRQGKQGRQCTRGDRLLTATGRQR